ncbi:MAG: homoserine O-acetyltransferase [Alphaproteobacteria bacterium]|nr:homoserine O-acetyltransferase [Alphaproteobacteria bacterium]
MPSQSKISETPPGGCTVCLPEPIALDGGAVLDTVEVAYTCYGQLNAARNNAILVCHALTGDHFMAETHPVTGKPGWWANIVGSGKPLNTDHYAIFCINVLGGCLGTLGPTSINPASGEIYGLDFPVITINDIVKVQHALMQYRGIPCWHAVVGGSMGAMQVLSWATHWPDKLRVAVPIAGAVRHSAQNIAFHEVGRQAIMADPDWCAGKYLSQNTKPKRGLAVARMAAHVTYLSEECLHEKFGRHLQDRDSLTYGFDADFRVESYLRHQGKSFVQRFDANSYLYLTRAMDYFDIEAEFGSLDTALRGRDVKYCVIAFTSDWLFPISESRVLVKALNRVGAEVSFSAIETNCGHDAFLLDLPPFADMLRGFIAGIAR